MNRATLGVRCHRIKKYIPIYLMLLPGAIYLLINNYIPMAGIVMAFKNLNFSKGIWNLSGIYCADNVIIRIRGNSAQ